MGELRLTVDIISRTALFKTLCVKGGTHPEKALHSAVAAPFACPASEAQHGDPSRHHQHGPSNPAALAQGRCRYMGLEALEKCYNVHRGLLRRLRVEVAVDYNSTKALRQKPSHVSAFCRSYSQL